MHVIGPRGRWVAEALELSRVMLGKAEGEGVAVLAASVVQGSAVILGAKQRAGRVVDMRACADAGAVVLRRATTGTAGWMPEVGLVFALALPHVAFLVPDATPRTLLNRNVRSFLKGFTKAGVAAHYFGREWISLRKQPAALLGFEVTRTGAVLIEVLVGFDEAMVLPEKLMTVEEKAVDRSPGKTVASLRDVCPDARIEVFAENVIAAIVEQLGASPVAFDPTIKIEHGPVSFERDPVPEGLVLEALRRVPIGYLESAVSPDNPERRWLGGDVLAPTWLYDDIALGKRKDESGDVAVDGASMADLVKGLTSK